MRKGNSLNRVLKIFFDAGRGKAVCIVIIYLLVSFIPSLLLILNREIFDSFSEDMFSFKLISALMLLYISLQIVSRILSFIQTRLMTMIRHDIQMNMQKEIQEKMLRINYLEFDNADTFNLIQRVSNNIPGKCASSVFMILDIIGMSVQMITAIVILIGIHWSVPIILVVFTIPYIFLYKKMCFDNYFQEVNQGKKHRKNWCLIKMLFEKHYNKELKIYDCFKYLGDKEKGINEDLHHENYLVAKKYSLFGVILDIVKSFGKAICMIIAIALIVYQNAGISAFTVLMQAMDSMQTCLMNAFSKFRDFGALHLAFEDYRKFHELEEEPDSGTPIQFDTEAPFIALKNVSFSYPTKTNALKNVNVTIEEGEKIAVVGKNGSGKTTLVNILLGFYQPASGDIEIAGTKLKDCIKDLRSRTVYIMQNTPEYSLSIEDNIQMGRDMVNPNIIKVLGIEGIIDKAPEGERTFLGEENDDQYNMYGGEWSKLGIARNTQKTDPVLYIMDEPTASLDPISESKIFESFHSITNGKTTIFISHRLGMVSLADRIIVLDNGDIVEQGSHDELMKRRGMYYDMYSEQIQLYQKQGEL